MGYDVYLSLTAGVPDASTAEQLCDALSIEDVFGPALETDCGETYLYAHWEGRNCSEDDVVALLQPLADQFGVTFDVTYNSDYDDGSQVFFVGAEAPIRQALHGLDQLGEILDRLGGEDMVLPIPADQLRAYRTQLRPKLTRLLAQLDSAGSSD